MTQTSLSMKQKQAHRHRGQICGRQEAGAGMEREFGISSCKLLLYKE